MFDRWHSVTNKHDIIITADVSSRGMELLHRLGFKSERELDSDQRRAAARVRLDQFLAKKQTEKLEDLL